MPKKFIFLDVDGVLNNSKWLLNEEWQEDENHTPFLDHIDDHNLDLLERLVNETGAKIILISSWRHEINKNDINEWSSVSRHVQVLLDKFEKRHLKLTDKTDTFMEKTAKLQLNTKFTRDLEIYDWLMHHAHMHDKFVIFDDEDIDTHHIFEKNFIRTRFSTGLTEENIQKAIEILNKESKYV